MILLVATLSGFLVTFMSSAVNIALPLIEAEFHMSAVALSWVSFSYTLVAGAILMPAGRIADVCGRVRFFVWGMIVFTVISFASALAPSGTVLIVLRALHGVGFALGMVTTATLVTLAYPPQSRGKALGLNISGIYLGLTLGPVLGGVIVHNIGWRGLFVVLGVLGLVTVAFSFWKLRHVEWREPKPASFDVAGSLIYAIALTALLLGFSLLPDALGAILAAIGVVGLGGFLWWETRAADPLLHVDLLRKNRVFAFANAAALINYAATFAMVFLLSLYLQYNRGLNPQVAGFVLVAGTFLQAVFSPVAGRLSDRLNARYLTAAGMAVCAAGLFALGFLTEATPYWYIIVLTCITGIGYAFFSAPVMHTIMGSVDKARVGTASATVATMRLAGMSISMGIATLVLAIEVGRQAIQTVDYPNLLTSVQASFFIFALLCVLGVAASLVGPRRGENPPAR